MSKGMREREREGQREGESMAPVFFCTHLFGVQVELYSLSSACVLGGRKKGRAKGRVERWWGGGGTGGSR